MPSPIDIFFPYAPLPPRTQRVTVAIPFDITLSKNRRLGTVRSGRVYIKADHKRACEALESLLRDSCASRVWRKDLYWLALHVQKPSNRVDAANFLDAIADCAKRAIGVDDAWLAVERITYEVIRGDDAERRIFISISQ